MTTEQAAARGSFPIPEIVKGPWTQAARQLAIDQESLQHFIDYFGKAVKTRRWSPWHDLPIDEMKTFGGRLTQETINLIEGFLGIEEYVGDYVEEGLEMFRNNRMRRHLQLQWGSEELKAVCQISCKKVGRVTLWSQQRCGGISGRESRHRTLTNSWLHVEKRRSSCGCVS